VTSLPGLVVGFGPVVLFLAALRFMDSYKLVSRGAVLRAIGYGCLVALATLVLHGWLLSLGLDPAVVRRYVAPLLEETLKASYVLVLIRTGKIGFLVDAAILGFAVGTGFALIENVYYARMLGASDLPLWIVRGLGTAVMHGSTTAIASILARSLTERKSGAWPWLLPGLGLAVLFHAAFNHLMLDPVVTAALLLVAMPVLLVLVFERSEAATRHWLGTSLDTDVELLELIEGGAIADSHVGRYLESLRERFPGGVVADMLCLLQIHAELALRAKGVLIARAAGIELPVDEQVRANLAELKFLRHTIGPTGMMAILPFVKTSDRDLWQLHLLKR
jgi:RsiW-degrading membrane proteinase PrsW (M82 family)